MPLECCTDQKIYQQLPRVLIAWALPKVVMLELG